ncbi:hypothetical protein C6P08_06925 [Weissella confusa]|uniref:phage replisome organizer N-terminal domain-containing protein n=1 Tax=Weissella TaxID=46255 RepID=UPI001091AC55|nr:MULTISPECIES: phage replisome organizer N-terminal domain-containing protein [Weissella]MBJ7694298.1 DnaD domain protein [Weissella confusa]NFA03608.1 DnaD domain protein [Weissella cibaria]QBZ04929.1 hypothetical protein C6P08_06925 [Weissella confusa]
MTDKKHWYYVRLNENHFEQERIIALESLADGYMYVNLYHKLLLRSLQHDGSLRFSKAIPYTPELLGRMCRLPAGVVKTGVEVLEQMEFVRRLNDGTILILDIEDHIGKTSSEAERKRKRRRAQKALIEAETNVGHLSAKRAPEIELEIDIELEQESETNNSNNTSISHKSAASALQASIDMLGLSVGDELPSDWLQFIDNWLQCVDPDDGDGMIVIATQLAVKRNQMTWAYVEGILRSWQRHGIRSLLDIRREQEAWQQRNQPVTDITEIERIDIPLDVDILNTDWSQFK